MSTLRSDHLLFNCRVAVIHDWLVDFSGSERVLEHILHVVPGADLFTLVNRMDPSNLAKLNVGHVYTSFLQNAPGVGNHLVKYLPLMPIAIEQFDLTGYDLIISSSHCVAKGVIIPPDALHLCYCHSPMRYVWDMQSVYLKTEGLVSGPSSWIARLVFHYLRQWDGRSANGVDAFAANSRFVAQRIQKVYRRKAHVIPPPVDIATTAIAPPLMLRDSRQLVTLGRLVGYKNVALMCEAMRLLPDYRLIVIGGGPLLEKFRRIAPVNVEMCGHLPDIQAQEIIRGSCAFLFAAVEDFGIAPVEALRMGVPIIAPARGGARDYVQDGRNGVLIGNLTAQGLADAVHSFQRVATSIAPNTCVESSTYFSGERFEVRFREWIEEQLSVWEEGQQ